MIPTNDFTEDIIMIGSNDFWSNQNIWTEPENPVSLIEPQSSYWFDIEYETTFIGSGIYVIR